MNRAEFKAYFINPFPAAKPGIRFGVDAVTFAKTTGPRLHAAEDLRLEWPENQNHLGHYVIAPMKVKRTVWHEIAQEGAMKDVTVLDLVNSDDSVRWRDMHIRPEEMIQAARSKIFPNGVPPANEFAAGGGLSIGEAIGPAGDAGLSLAAPAGEKPAPGASARHLHYALLLTPGVYDEVLDEAFGEDWRRDKIADWGSEHPGFFKKLKDAGWIWANDLVAARKDPYVGRVLYAVNARRLLEW